MQLAQHGINSHEVVPALSYVRGMEYNSAVFYSLVYTPAKYTREVYFLARSLFKHESPFCDQREINSLGNREK